ncbi:hypothetical protein V6N12_022691 [Hibiscus sabdariffa]|uniref:Uncharacterized protein n=1 Tax=Hibiscus sabdariffa TaxID=183260 RepID=A0ABR2FVG4_9ROSI
MIGEHAHSLYTDLHQGPDLLCLLAKRGGVRAPRDAVLARVQVGVGARVYPGKILCCRVDSRVSEAGEDAYLVIISNKLIRIIISTMLELDDVKPSAWLELQFYGAGLVLSVCHGSRFRTKILSFLSCVVPIRHVAPPCRALSLRFFTSLKG